MTIFDIVNNNSKVDVNLFISFINLLDESKSIENSDYRKTIFYKFYKFYSETIRDFTLKEVVDYSFNKDYLEDFKKIVPSHIFIIVSITTLVNLHLTKTAENLEKTYPDKNELDKFLKNNKKKNNKIYKEAYWSLKNYEETLIALGVKDIKILNKLEEVLIKIQDIFTNETNYKDEKKKQDLKKMISEIIKNASIEEENVKKKFILGVAPNVIEFFNPLNKKKIGDNLENVF